MALAELLPVGAEEQRHVEELRHGGAERLVDRPHPIRVAAGEKLAFKQKDIKRDGWAMECRINAEDPFRNFLPSTGRLVKYRPPAQNMEASQPVPPGGGVRVDTGVYEGGEIPMHYDSMIAKLIVTAATREIAIARMKRALGEFTIRGIKTTIPFQLEIINHPDFINGTYDIGWVARFLEERNT